MIIQSTLRYHAEKIIENEMCFFLFSLQILSENFLILRRIQKDITINLHQSLCKVPVILARF